MSQPPDQTREIDPADRLEAALNRIAYALDRRSPASPHGPDLQAVAANIDALCARIGDVLGPDADDAPRDRSGVGFAPGAAAPTHLEG